MMQKVAWYAHEDAHEVSPGEDPLEENPIPGLLRFEGDEMVTAWHLDGIDTVIFDMDGTLIDSRYDWVAIREALEIEGHSIIDELNRLESPKREEKWELLRHFEHEASLTAEVKDGAVDLLAFLREKGVNTALVTNNSLDNVTFLLDRFNLAFDTVLTRDSGLYKPSGAPLLEVMRRLGVRPEQCMYVGDYLYDIQAGREAGCGTVCLVFDRRFCAEADISFSDLRALLSYLKRAPGPRESDTF